MKRSDPPKRNQSVDAPLAKVRSGEEAIAEIEAARKRVLSAARAAMGVTGETVAEPMRAVMKQSGVGFYPLAALGVLLIVSEFHSYGLLVLGPEIGRALGLSKTAIAGVLAMKTLAVSLATLPMAAYVQRHPRRAGVAIVTGFGWALMTMFTGFATSALILTIFLALDGASTASVSAVHPPLLMDTYATNVRVRVLSAYRGAREIGQIIAPLTVGALVAIFGFTWRGVFLITGIICVGAALFSMGLRDPGFGRWDAARVREIVRGESADEALKDVELGFFEIVRRILLIPTVHRILIAYATVGMLLVPLITYTTFFLDIRWGLSPGWRGVFFAGVALVGLPCLAIFGPRAESLFARDPARLVTAAALLLFCGVVLVALSVAMPLLPLMFVLFAASFACFACCGPGLNILLLGLVPPRMRPHAAALAGIFLAGVGGFAGLMLLGGMERRFGTGGAIISMALPGIAAALVLRSARKLVGQDLDRMVGDMVEEEELRVLASQGTSLPMLACRNIDFSYDQLQVLFDVSFTVDEGEIVALLGTNGAGKSTLLRVISGLGFPTRGSVRFKGAEITYLNAERRLRFGITQIPSGRAVFAPLTVFENLRLFGYSYGRDRGSIMRGIDTSFEAFPRLAERRNQLASTLSGGEQQMLGLSKALILRPRLLLVDELSLGLAPKVVTELLDMVRHINDAGTAIVLVEQSVNIALSIVEHAYFMEKGEIRFDGRAQDLIRRSDLLRSVFLEGATKALGGENGSAPASRRRRSRS